MAVNEVADGWYWNRPHGEEGGHDEYLATDCRAVLIDDNRGLGVGPTRPKTAYYSIPVPKI